MSIDKNDLTYIPSEIGNKERFINDGDSHIGGATKYCTCNTTTGDTTVEGTHHDITCPMNPFYVGEMKCHECNHIMEKQTTEEGHWYSNHYDWCSFYGVCDKCKANIGNGEPHSETCDFYNGPCTICYGGIECVHLPEKENEIVFDDFIDFKKHRDNCPLSTEVQKCVYCNNPISNHKTDCFYYKYDNLENLNNYIYNKNMETLDNFNVYTIKLQDFDKQLTYNEIFKTHFSNTNVDYSFQNILEEFGNKWRYTSDGENAYRIFGKYEYDNAINKLKSENKDIDKILINNNKGTIFNYDYNISNNHYIKFFNNNYIQDKAINEIKYVYKNTVFISNKLYTNYGKTDCPTTTITINKSDSISEIAQQMFKFNIKGSDGYIGIIDTIDRVSDQIIIKLKCTLEIYDKFYKCIINVPLVNIQNASGLINIDKLLNASIVLELLDDINDKNITKNKYKKGFALQLYYFLKGENINNIKLTLGWDNITRNSAEYLLDTTNNGPYLYAEVFRKKNISAYNVMLGEDKPKNGYLNLNVWYDLAVKDDANIKQNTDNYYLSKLINVIQFPDLIKTKVVWGYYDSDDNNYVTIADYNVPRYIDIQKKINFHYTTHIYCNFGVGNFYTYEYNNKAIKTLWSGKPHITAVGNIKRDLNDGKTIGVKYSHSRNSYPYPYINYVYEGTFKEIYNYKSKDVNIICYFPTTYDFRDRNVFYNFMSMRLSSKNWKPIPYPK